LPFIAQGPVFLALRTDADQDDLEPDTRADNSASTAFQLHLPAADLSVVEITAPALAVSGGSADIRWSVRNDGNASSDLALWHDRVLLSSDTQPRRQRHRRGHRCHMPARWRQAKAISARSP
jgi:hypothetical protein